MENHWPGYYTRCLLSSRSYHQLRVRTSAVVVPHFTGAVAVVAPCTQSRSVCRLSSPAGNSCEVHRWFCHPGELRFVSSCAHCATALGVLLLFMQWVCSHALCLCSGLASLLLWLRLPLLLRFHSYLCSLYPIPTAGWPWYYSPVVRPWRLHPMPLLLPFLDGSSDVFCRRAAFCLLVLLTSAAGCSSFLTVFTAVGSSSSLGHRVSPVPLLPAPRSWLRLSALPCPPKPVLLFGTVRPSLVAPKHKHSRDSKCTIAINSTHLLLTSGARFAAVFGFPQCPAGLPPLAPAQHKAPAGCPSQWAFAATEHCGVAVG